MIDARPASPSQDPRKQALENALQYDFAPIRKILNAVVPRWDVRESISELYEDCLDYRCSQDLRNSLNLPEPAIDSLAMEVGLARIASAPQAFVVLVMERYRSLWTMYPSSHPDSAPVLKAFIDEHRPLPFQDRIPSFDQIPQPSRLALFVRPVIIAIGGLTLMLGVFGLIGAFYRNLDTRLAGASLTSLTLHGSLLFTALVSLGIARYTLGLWPVMMASLILAAAWAHSLATRHSQPLS